MPNFPAIQANKGFAIYIPAVTCSSHSNLTILPHSGHLTFKTMRPPAVAIKSQIRPLQAGHLTIHIPYTSHSLFWMTMPCYASCIKCPISGNFQKFPLPVISMDRKAPL